MGKNIAQSITYYILIQSTKIEDIASLRKFHNLLVSWSTDGIWLSGLTQAQLDAIAFKSILFKVVYEKKGDKLYLLNSLLPSRNVPEVTWTAISEALPVNIGSINQNYFGVSESLELGLAQELNERKPHGLIVSVEELAEYVKTAPSFRLNPLKWTLLNGTKALIINNPILPIPGMLYWKCESSLIPSGENFEFADIHKQLAAEIIASENAILVWNLDGTYFIVPNNLFQKLTIASVRKTVQALADGLTLENNG